MHIGKAGRKVDQTEILTNLGVVLTGTLAILAAYFKKGTPIETRQSAIMTSVGVEIGNRQQADEMIKALHRIADILEDKKQRGIEADLKEILERLDEHEKHRRL
jgi:hypothetical protein